MKCQVFTIYDTAACMYEPPLCFRADGEAMRFWKTIVLNPDTKVGKNPEDFSFYKIAVWDDNKAEYEPLNKMCVSTGQEIIAQSRQIEPGSLKGIEQYGEEIMPGGNGNDIGGTD